MKEFMNYLFYELLQVTVGARDKLSRDPSDDDWCRLFDLCQQQTVAGVTLNALDCLTEKGQKAPFNLIMEWIGLAEQIKQQNKIVDTKCLELQDYFNKKGYKSCILKGQGNAALYPIPDLRTSGDIDIWIDGEKKEIISFVLSRYPNAMVREHHVDFPIFDEIDVEVHFKPVSALSVLRERKLEKYFNNIRADQFVNRVSLSKNAGEIIAPTFDFNIVYQMAHMMKHFFSEGLGMRHLMDYYYLLMSQDSKTGHDITNTLKELGMIKFAGAVMWILGYVFLLDEGRMICIPDEKRGKLILEEIMVGGNFGHCDIRFAKKLMGISTTLSVMARNTKLAWTFPEEAVSAPISNVIRSFLV